MIIYCVKRRLTLILLPYLLESVTGSDRPPLTGVCALECVCTYLQFFSGAGEHIGNALVHGPCLLEQQKAFRSGGKVQQGVQ